MNIKADVMIYDLYYKIDMNFDKLCIIGPSGKGKSTFLKCIHRLVDYDGYILIDNDMSYKSVLMTQHAKLFDGTVYENLYKVQKLCGTPNHDKIMQYLTATHLDSYKDVNINRLSGGEYQRICIIRSLLCNADLLLFDEPASSLDKDNTLLFSNLLRNINTPVIYITHNLALSFGQTIHITDLLI